MWGWLTCEYWCCGLGGFAASFLSLFVFLYVIVVSTLSSGYVRAPLPYRLVNAGLFDYKKKKKKKKTYVYAVGKQYQSSRRTSYVINYLGIKGFCYIRCGCCIWERFPHKLA